MPVLAAPPDKGSMNAIFTSAAADPAPTAATPKAPIMAAQTILRTCRTMAPPAVLRVRGSLPAVTNAGAHGASARARSPKRQMLMSRLAQDKPRDDCFRLLRAAARALAR